MFLKANLFSAFWSNCVKDCECSEVLQHYLRNILSFFQFYCASGHVTSATRQDAEGSKTMMWRADLDSTAPLAPVKMFIFIWLGKR